MVVFHLHHLLKSEKRRKNKKRESSDQDDEDWGVRSECERWLVGCQVPFEPSAENEQEEKMAR